MRKWQDTHVSVTSRASGTGIVCGPPQSLRAGFQCGRGLRPLPPLGPSQQRRVGSRISQGRASYAAVTNDPKSQQLKKAKADFWLTQRVCHIQARAGQPPCPTRRGRPGTRPDGRRLVAVHLPPRRPLSAALPRACDPTQRRVSPGAPVQHGGGHWPRGERGEPPTPTPPPRCSMTKGTHCSGGGACGVARLSDTQGK